MIAQLSLFVAGRKDSIDAQKGKPGSHKPCYQNEKPLHNSADSLCLRIEEEIGIDERSVSRKIENACIKMISPGVKKDEAQVCDRKECRCNRIVPLHFLMLVKQHPVPDIQHRQHDVHENTFYNKVFGRVAPRLIRQKEVEYQEGQEDSEHSDKLDSVMEVDIAVFLFSRSLDKLCQHDARTKIIRQIGKVDIEAPHKYVIKKADTSEDGHNGKRKIAGLVDQLERPISGNSHKKLPSLATDLILLYKERK